MITIAGAKYIVIIFIALLLQSTMNKDSNNSYSIVWCSEV